MADLILVCKICRWRPPEDLEVNLLQAHFDMEPDHDPENITVELVAICDRCDVEMPVERSIPRPSGGTKVYHGCPKCHRTKVVIQNEQKGDGDV